MPFPLEISFHGLDRSESLEGNVREHAARLEEFYDRITSCHVVLEKPHRHHHHGNVYHVRIHIAVPRRELIVDREPGKDHAHEDPYVTVRDAFKAMRRQLEDHARELRGDVKTHATPLRGRIARLHPELDCGWIETPDGSEIYFHRNSVLNEVLEKLKVGSQVHFVEEQGAKGPQACGVRVVAGKREPRFGTVGRHDETATVSSNGHPSSETTPSAVDAVRLRAYQRWEAAGRPDGDGVNFWLEAERDLSQQK